MENVVRNRGKVAGWSKIGQEGKGHGNEDGTSVGVRCMRVRVVTGFADWGTEA